MTSIKLPTWEQCEQAVDNKTASPLEIFIFHNEPGGKEPELCIDVRKQAIWREQLLDLLNDVIDMRGIGKRG